MWRSISSFWETETKVEQEEDSEEDNEGPDFGSYVEKRVLLREKRRGIVTSVQDDYALIDGEIFWPREIAPKAVRNATNAPAGGFGEAVKPKEGWSVQFFVEQSAENEAPKVVGVEEMCSPDYDECKDGWGNESSNLGIRDAFEKFADEEEALEAAESGCRIVATVTHVDYSGNVVMTPGTEGYGEITVQSEVLAISHEIIAGK